MVALSFMAQGYQSRAILQCFVPDFLPDVTLRRRANLPRRANGRHVHQRGEIGRGERIRTSGLYVPNVALYQAKLHPDRWPMRQRCLVLEGCGISA